MNLDHVRDAKVVEEASEVATCVTTPFSEQVEDSVRV